MPALAGEASFTTQTPLTPEVDLVTLASPMFELVMRIRAGLVQPSMELQTTIDRLLTRVEQRGRGLHYAEKQLEAAKFALASYIDEMVLMADFPFHDEWEKYPLQLKYFGEHLAGVRFFERLTELLKDVERQGDLVELYYMCLLLGYKGRFRDYFEDELVEVVRQVEQALRQVNRLRTVAQSPHWLLDDQPGLYEETRWPKWLLGLGIGSLGVGVLAFLVFKLGIERVLQAALRSLIW